MKVIVVFLSAVVMVMVEVVAAGGAVAWPGAVPLSVPYHSVKTVVPSETTGFAYSTSQYINAVPAQGNQPQFGYQISYPGYPNYSPLLAATYYPSSSFFYPSLSPIAPAAPAPVDPITAAQPPAQSPSAGQPAGDEDTAVIESADMSPDLQPPLGASPSLPANGLPSGPQSVDSKNMREIPQIPHLVPSFPQTSSLGSGFPQLPQFPGLPQFPQQVPQIPNLPQFPQQVPQFPGLPQFPQQVPQFPQLPQFPQQVPQFPNLPQFPQIPQQPQIPQIPQVPSNPSFPQSPSNPSDNSDRGINDEDTVSVDAA